MGSGPISGKQAFNRLLETPPRSSPGAGEPSLAYLIQHSPSFLKERDRGRINSRTALHSRVHFLILPTSHQEGRCCDRRAGGWQPGDQPRPLPSRWGRSCSGTAEGSLPPQQDPTAPARRGVCPSPRHAFLGHVCSVSRIPLPVTCTDLGACTSERLSECGLVTRWPERFLQLGTSSAHALVGTGPQQGPPGSPHLESVHLPPGLQDPGGRVSVLLRAGAGGPGRALLAGVGLRVLLRGTAGRTGRSGLLRGLQGIEV